MNLCSYCKIQELHHTKLLWQPKHRGEGAYKRGGDAHCLTCGCKFQILVSLRQRSKLTFSKSCLLATYNRKMVAIKQNSVAPPKRLKERTLYDILHEGLKRRMARVNTSLCYSQRKRRKRLSSRKKRFISTLQSCWDRVTLAMVHKTPSNQSNLPFWAAAHFKFTLSTFWTTRGENRKTGDASTID